MIIRRSADVVFIDDEQFALADLLSLFPDYDKSEFKAHYYDGRKHYVSDGSNQYSCSIPYGLALDLSERIPELRMCRSQRIADTKYFENLRNARRK